MLSIELGLVQPRSLFSSLKMFCSEEGIFSPRGTWGTYVFEESARQKSPHQERIGASGVRRAQAICSEMSGWHSAAAAAASLPAIVFACERYSSDDVNAANETRRGIAASPQGALMPAAASHFQPTGVPRNAPRS